MSRFVASWHSMLLLMTGAIASPLIAQDSPDKKQVPTKGERDDSPVTLESLDVNPAEPGRDSLCQLKLKVRNRGTKAVTYFAFGVSINGRSVPVYKTSVYGQTVPPNSVAEIKLYNFWVSERGRELPADGQLRIEVELVQAYWVEVKTDGKKSEQSLVGKVDGLPVKATKTIAVRSGKAP